MVLRLPASVELTPAAPHGRLAIEAPSLQASQSTCAYRDLRRRGGLHAPRITVGRTLRSGALLPLRGLPTPARFRGPPCVFLRKAPSQPRVSGVARCVGLT